VLLFDIMSTLVLDPFYQEMPRFFGMTFEELLANKHPTAWVQVWSEHQCARASTPIRVAEPPGANNSHSLFPETCSLNEERYPSQNFFAHSFWTSASLMAPP
jgi:hypothetical protein